MALNLPFVNVTRSRGTGLPFVDFDSNNVAAPTQQATPRRQLNAGSQPTTQPAPDPYTGGSAGASADAQERQATLYGIENGIRQADDGLGRLDRRLQDGYGNIDRQFESQYGVLTGNRSRNTDRFQRQSTDQLNEYQGNRNQVADNARSWLTGAQNALGANGAGGGSKARYVLPFEAQTMAAKGNASAQATNNRNISALTDGYREDEAQFMNAEQDLVNQRDQGKRDFQSQIESQRSELLNTRGSLAGQQAIASGGDFRAAQAASQPYTSKIPNILDMIDRLSVTSPVQARQVVTGRPDLAGYNWSRPNEAPVAQQDPTLAVDPILSLFGMDDQRQYA